MKRHAIEATAGALCVLWLLATGVLLFYAAGLATIPYLLIAFVVMQGAFLVLLTCLLVTNTRRPFGVDPNASTATPRQPAPANRERDPFAATTDELRPRVVLNDGFPYGSRRSDDVSVVRRLIDRLETDDGARPVPDSAPSWALDLVESHAAEIFPDAPKESEES